MKKEWRFTTYKRQEVDSLIRGLLYTFVMLLVSISFWLLLEGVSYSTGVNSDESLKVVIEEVEGLIKEGDRLIIDRFSMETEEKAKGYFIPRGWNLLRFSKIKTLTNYTPIENSNNVFIKAESEGSAAPIYKVSKFDPKEYTYLSWRWKVENILEKGNAHIKEGDDFSVSLGIIFDYDPQRASLRKKILYTLVKLFYGVYPPDYVIAYVWGNGVHVKKGDKIANPYSKIVKMFVLENGSKHLNQWITEERNILEDFKEAFGAYPKQKVGGIAIHTHSDDTSNYYKEKYRAVGYYDDIIVSKTPNL